jgi:pimeloyl-ACP methyl ester carboxylesterase
MTPKFLFFRSSRIQYHVVGEGEPLLLVHGYQADSRIWEKMVPLLKEHFMLIIPDLPGHGQSPLIQATNDMDFLADVLYSIILSGGHSGISIAGHSMGVMLLWHLPINIQILQTGLYCSTRIRLKME